MINSLPSSLSRWFVLLAILGTHGSLWAQQNAKSSRVETPPPNHPPLERVDVAVLPGGVEHLDLFLLLGQSNMKGRGVMPEEPQRDPRIKMMHLRDDAWYIARDPLHLIGDATTFSGADNAGVGPGLAFANALIAKDSKRAIGLIPCAKGGSAINLWQRGGNLYDEAVRRAKQALQAGTDVKATIRGALWLQGEANANSAGLEVHAEKLSKLIDDLREDLNLPELPFIACTIGEMVDAEKLSDVLAMNRILLSLPSRRANTACVDARDLKTHIGDRVHFDTQAQNAIGKRFAESYWALQKSSFHWVAPLSANELQSQGLPENLAHATFKSPSMGIEVGYYIYLPPGYATSQDRYPVVFHLHGGRPGAEKKSVKLANYIHAALTAGEIASTIYVFPNGGPFSWYDMPEMVNGLGESVFVEELIPHIDSVYRTWGTRAGRGLEGYSQGGRGTTRIMFKYPEMFASVAPGGSGYGPEYTIQQNDGFESENLQFLPIGTNAWDLAKAYASRDDVPPMSILIWDGTECFNYDDNLKYSAYLTELGVQHKMLVIPGVGHTVVGSYEKNGADIMQHHQQTFSKYNGPE
jgi:endo-1,4-beta-xylanase